MYPLWHFDFMFGDDFDSSLLSCDFVSPSDNYTKATSANYLLKCLDCSTRISYILHVVVIEILYVVLSLLIDEVLFTHGHLLFHKL